MMSRLVRLLVLGSLITIPKVALATMDLTFDMSALGNPNLDPSNVYVTFAATDSVLTYGSGGSAESINFSGGSLTISGTSYGTSKAYSIADIQANGLTLTSATSLIGFISYGSSSGIQLLGVGSQPVFFSASTARYSNFEVTYSGTTGGADLTNISQYGGSLRMEFISSGSTQSYVQNTLNTGDTFRALAATSGNSSGAVLSQSGEFVRVIGPNVFPASVSGTNVQNPYPQFNNYLQNLHTNSGTSSVVNDLTNLAPGQSAGGTGAVGTTSTGTSTNVSANSGYNLDYHFDAVVNQESTDGPNGTYSVTLTGKVNATAQSGTTGVQTFEYDGLTITIAADDLQADNLFMTNFLYQEATTGQGIDVDFSGWDALNNDFGSAFVFAALQQKAAGDFAQGMLNGFVGSAVVVSGTALGDMTSYEWWQNPELAYEPAQPDNPFYSAWGNVVSENSDGNNNGDVFARGGVYGSVYDDRFNLNLISPDASTDTMKITLLADGNLAVPEPAACVLVLGGAAFFIARRSRKFPLGQA